MHIICHWKPICNAHNISLETNLQNPSDVFPAELPRNNMYLHTKEVQVEVVGGGPIAVALAGGAAFGCDHTGFLAGICHVFIVLPHVATQSLASGKSLVTDVAFVNPTAWVEMRDTRGVGDCSSGGELRPITVAGFMAAECLV
ncbi:unnamed protein product [Fraxinus pennsylvanica]|uniref:Uncharacterized protein n=1 Tax=Fraxinus pennsylvanica TaxID=56036 RepID=A0AAD1Z585_9LAMI|nr:unnamed protein product [Fraxinus pennsylvanica]